MAESVPTPARQRPVSESRSDRAAGPDADGPPTGVRSTRRWRGVTGLTLLAIGVGLLVREPGLLLASVFGVAFAAYGHAGTPPTPSLAADRTVGTGLDGDDAGGQGDDGGVPPRARATTDTDRVDAPDTDRVDATDTDRVDAPDTDRVDATDTDRVGAPQPVAGEPDFGVGDRVSVTVAVTNEGETSLPDLRLVDGVPDGLAVVEGSPRLATALRPGETAELSYAVEATRGRHEFDPTIAIVRDVTGATERVIEVAAGGRIDCVPPLPADPPAFPLRDQTTRYTGRTTAEEGGPGVEFHATRAYRPGDPLSRIDWKRTARTRELTTVEYRLERAASVVVVVDARPPAFAATDSHARSAVDRSVEAAGEIAAGLLAAGHLVGLAAIGPRGCWLAPARGPEHRHELAETLARSDAFARTPPDGDANVYAACRAIRGRIADDTQVVFCSPLVDDDAETIVHRLEAYGHHTTVVSPDPSTDGTVGRAVGAIARRVRVTDVRHAGVPTIDWDSDEPLAVALARIRGRRSA